MTPRVRPARSGEAAEIAAGLMGLPVDEVRPHVLAAKTVKPERVLEAVEKVLL